MNIEFLTIWSKRFAAILVCVLVVSFALDQILIGWHYPMGNAPKSASFLRDVVGTKKVICVSCLMCLCIYLLRRKEA